MASFPTVEASDATDRRSHTPSVFGTVLRTCMAVALVLTAIFGALMTAEAKSVAPADDILTYTMRPGDTLITLAEAYFERPGDYKRVQRMNNIANPRRISIGRKIAIPRELLKYRPIAINLASFRGPVTVNGAPARAGVTLPENTVMRTGAQGFATLVFDNGSRMAMPSNSSLSIRNARIYQIDDSRDVEIVLTSGSVRTKVQPHGNSGDRTRIRTRHSVTAVRGTEFGTALSSDDTAMVSEVYEGQIAVDPENAPSDSGNLVNRGEGVRLSETGERLVAPLLPAPALNEPGKVQSGEELSFAIAQSAPDAVAHRVEIATDVSFIDQILDERSTASAFTLPALPDGRYYLRLSAIDANGFVGMPVTYAFRRIRSGASASAAVSDDGYLFRWQTYGARKPDVRLRIYAGTVDSTPLVDEAALAGESLKLSDLPPGEYFWQIGSRLIDEGDVIENWSQPEKLIVAP